MGSHRWLVALAVLGCLFVGVAAYDVGLMQGAARAAAAAGTPPPYGYAWGWHHPWGFGFGFPIFFFIFFWLIIARAMFWGGPWRRRRWHYDRDDYRASFDEWHRRAHERMNSGDSPRTV